MRHFPTFAVLLISLSLAVSLAARAADAPLTTPEAVLRRAEEKFRSLTDYRCRATLASQNGKRSESGEYQVWVKLPGMLRVHVDRGRGRGSDVAMARDGSIRGRKGGLLKAFVIGLDVDDKRLRSIRGNPVTEFDWGSFYRKLRAHAALPGARLTLEPRAESAIAPYVLVVTYTSGGKNYREVTRIDPTLWVMVGGDVYEGTVLVDHVEFREIQFNTGLTDGFFRL
jgi:outer membrane lipoprotein-sorting protein